MALQSRVLMPLGAIRRDSSAAWPAPPVHAGPCARKVPRWLSTALFVAPPIAVVVGWVATASVPVGYYASYALAQAVTLIAAILGAINMRRSLSTQPLVAALWLLFFVAYPLKLYVIAIADSGMQEAFLPVVSQAGQTPRILAAASSVTAWTFLSISCVMVVLSKRKARTTHGSGMASIGSDRLLSGLCLASFVALVASLVQWHYNIALMGALANDLPFRLAGWTVYVQIAFVPTFILCLIYRAESVKRRAFTGAALALLLCHAALYQAQTASRGYVLSVVLLVGFYWAAQRQLTSRRIAYAAVIVVLIIGLRPFLTLVRYSRVLGNMEMSDSFGNAYESTIHSSSPFGAFPAAALGSILRLTGSDGLVLAVSRPLDGSPFDNMKYLYNDPTRPSARVFTQDWVGSFSPRTQFAPGLVTMFYLVGGTLLASVGMASVLVLAALGWGYLVTQPKRIYGSVAAAVLGANAVVVVMEGDLDQLPVRAAAYTASLLFAQWFFGGRLREKSLGG